MYLNKTQFNIEIASHEIPFKKKMSVNVRSL